MLRPGNVHGYAIRLPAISVLQENISHLLTRPVGLPPNHVRRHYASFSYQATKWSQPHRLVQVGDERGVHRVVFSAGSR